MNKNKNKIEAALLEIYQEIKEIDNHVARAKKQINKITQYLAKAKEV